MAEILIRQITEDDADAVSEMWLRLVNYHTALDPSLPAAARGGQHRYVRRLLDRLSDPNTRVLVADVDGRVVGYVLGMVIDLMQDIFVQQPGGFIADIYVEPDYRGGGIGSALVDTLVEWFRVRHVAFMEWQVAAANQDGQHFWQKMGGRPVMIRMRADFGE